MYESRYATREDIDAAMRLGCGLPMGPLALLDLIGLDTAYEILETMYQQSPRPAARAGPMLKQMVTAGLLGRKSGRGFYTYAEPGSPEVVADARHPAGDAETAGARPVAQGRRRRLRHDGHRHRRGLRQGRLRRRLRRPRPGQGRQRCRPRSAKSLDKAVQRGRLTEDDRDEVLGRLTGTTSLDDLADVDLVVEAVAEDLEVKQELFATLDEICKPGAVLATTTSSAAGHRVRRRRPRGRPT